MNLRSLIISFAITSLLAGCIPLTPSPTEETPIPTLSQTPTQTARPTSTATVIPSSTFIPNTFTITPTFDVSTIVTVTPAQAEVCPPENPKLAPNFPGCNDTVCYGETYHEAILNFLNAGGTLDKLEKRWGTAEDLTKDGLKELLRSENGYSLIYGCNNGRYEILMEYKGTQRTPYISDVVDINGNGIPEIIILNAERHAFSSIQIFEWNGEEFISLIKRSGPGYVSDVIGGTAFEYKIANINNDGVKEIVAIDNELFGYENLSGQPLRIRTTILGWNGTNFVVLSDEHSSPQYRFQAIQDADRYARNGQYKQALSLYQSAIFNDRLEWWSKERQEYEVYTSLNSYFDEDYRNHPISLTATPTAFPTMQMVSPDPNEYPRLAAYAFYRIMLLHVLQGYDSDAGRVYNTLQQRFPEGNPGFPYAEMATSFWNEYQSSHNVAAACEVAVQYVTEHPEILVPLGSDYHGAQSYTYAPEDVCPFQ